LLLQAAAPFAPGGPSTVTEMVEPAEQVKLQDRTPTATQEVAAAVGTTVIPAKRVVLATRAIR